MDLSISQPITDATKAHIGLHTATNDPANKAICRLQMELSTCERQNKQLAQSVTFLNTIGKKVWNRKVTDEVYTLRNIRPRCFAIASIGPLSAYVSASNERIVKFHVTELDGDDILPPIHIKDHSITCIQFVPNNWTLLIGSEENLYAYELAVSVDCQYVEKWRMATHGPVTRILPFVLPSQPYPDLWACVLGLADNTAWELVSPTMNTRRILPASSTRSAKCMTVVCGHLISWLVLAFGDGRISKCNLVDPSTGIEETTTDDGVQTYDVESIVELPHSLMRADRQGDLMEDVYYATAGRDRAITFWKDSGFVRTCINRLVGHGNWIRSMLVTGQYLLSASDDGLLNIWELPSGVASVTPRRFKPLAVVSMSVCNARQSLFLTSLGEIMVMHLKDLIAHKSAQSPELVPTACSEESKESHTTHSKMSFENDSHTCPPSESSSFKHAGDRVNSISKAAERKMSSNKATASIDGKPVGLPLKTAGLERHDRVIDSATKQGMDENRPKISRTTVSRTAMQSSATSSITQTSGRFPLRLTSDHTLDASDGSSKENLRMSNNRASVKGRVQLKTSSLKKRTDPQLLLGDVSDRLRGLVEGKPKPIAKH